MAHRAPVVAILTAAVDTRGTYLPALRASIAASMTAAGVPDDQWQWVIQLDGPDPQPLAAVIANWNDPHVSVHAMNRHGGPATTRTAALAHIRAPILITVDEDDVLIPDTIPLLLHVLRTQAHVQWVGAGHYGPILPHTLTEGVADVTSMEREQIAALLDTPCTGEYGTWHRYTPAITGFVPVGGVRDAWHRIGRFPLIGGTVAYRTAAVVTAGGWPAVHRSEDTALLVAVSNRSPGWAVTAPVIAYRQHPAQNTRDAAKTATRTAVHELMHVLYGTPHPAQLEARRNMVAVTARGHAAIAEADPSVTTGLQVGR